MNSEQQTMTNPDAAENSSERSKKRIRQTLWTASLVVLPLFVFVVCQPLITRFHLLWRGCELSSSDRHAGLPTWVPEVFRPWFGRVDQAVFRGTEFTVGDIDRLRIYPQLQQVTVLGADIPDDAFAAIAKHKQLTAVRIFSSRMDEAGLRHLATLTKLTSIELGRMSLGSTAWENLAKCRSLEYLTLNETTINNEHLVELSALPHLSNLQLYDSGITDRGLEHVTRCANLEFLEIRKGLLTDTSIASLSSHSKLRSLWLRECGNGDAHAQTLASACPPRLELLMLTGATTTDAALPHVAKLTGLRTLILWEVSITDDGLAPLASCPSLELLNLSRTRTTPSGIAKLQRLNPKLGIHQQ